MHTHQWELFPILAGEHDEYLDHVQILGYLADVNAPSVILANVDVEELDGTLRTSLGYISPEIELVDKQVEDYALYLGKLMSNASRMLLALTKIRKIVLGSLTDDVYPDSTDYKMIEILEAFGDNFIKCPECTQPNLHEPGPTYTCASCGLEWVDELQENVNPKFLSK